MDKYPLAYVQVLQWERVLFWGKALRKEIQAPFSCYLTGTCLWPVTLPPETSFFTSHGSTWQGGVTGNSFSHSLTLLYLSLTHVRNLCFSISWDYVGERMALIQPHSVYLFILTFSLHPWSYHSTILAQIHITFFLLYEHRIRCLFECSCCPFSIQ